LLPLAIGYEKDLAKNAKRFRFSWVNAEQARREGNVSHQLRCFEPRIGFGWLHKGGDSRWLSRGRRTSQRSDNQEETEDILLPAAALLEEKSGQSILPLLLNAESVRVDVKRGALSFLHDERHGAPRECETHVSATALLSFALLCSQER
jgi:hypothetical protein